MLAKAKINLCLEVLGKRADGYHEVATVLHTIGLGDELTVVRSGELRLDCQPEVSPPEDNLALRAAKLLQEMAGCRMGAAITLRKRVPAAAGLGGGSSDAATTLMALNDLWGLGLHKARLAELAARLGADVPFFLQGGCALAEGMGELLTPLPALHGWWAVLLCPPLEVQGKTGRLYGMLSAQDFSDGSATRRLAEQMRSGHAGLSDIARVGNAFERVANRAFPGLANYRNAFEQAGAPFVRLSGSGPALFTLVGVAEEGSVLAERLRSEGYHVYLAALV